MEQRSRADIEAALTRIAAERQQATEPHPSTPPEISEQQQRLCNDPAVFETLDPPSGQQESREKQVTRQRAAKNFCRVCPASIICLDETIREETKPLSVREITPTYDVRGGLTRRERSMIMHRPWAGRSRRA